MERQIKFRGKRFDNEEWIVGDLMENQGRFFIYHATSETTIEDNDDYKITVSAVEVNPATMGQFTGLLDRNGKEIYEDDILGCPEDDYFLHEVVIFAEGCFMVKDDYTTITMCAVDTQYRTVIGNIHDNPSLISDKQ